MSHSFDVIIIGGGPNGLEAGAYLSKAGLKVLILERRYEIGGGLATEEITLPNYLHNTHAIYMMMADYAPLYKDLMLEHDYQCEHIYPPLQFALPLSDGKAVCLYSDLEKTCENFSQFSRKDAEAYRNFYAMAKTCMEEFIAPATYVPPLPTLDAITKMQSNDIGKIVLEYSEKTPKEIVEEHFEDDRIRALMLYLACQWGIEYDQSGLGYLVLLYLNRATNYRLVAGGSHRVASALGKIVGLNGGVILNNQRIKRIMMEKGEARGVEMEDGAIYGAEKAVISTIDLEQTFFQLVGEDNLEEEFREKLKCWQWEKYSLFGVHLAMEEPPSFSAMHSNGDVNRAFVYVLGFEAPEQLTKYFDSIYLGKLPSKTIINCCFPSVHDPSMAPSGRCSGLISQMLPYGVEGGAERWYGIEFKEEIADRCLETLYTYAPNLGEDKVLWRYISTPLDLENKFKNMVYGSYKQGAYIPLQMGYQRPNDECSQTRTPISKLYIGGSSCYPGGCVIWGPGYVVANVVADDIGLNKWWVEPEFVRKARMNGLI